MSRRPTRFEILLPQLLRDAAAAGIRDRDAWTGVLEWSGPFGGWPPAEATRPGAGDFYDRCEIAVSIGCDTGGLARLPP
jgi:hypothetical protein